jgi:hypothetical protein
VLATKNWFRVSAFDFRLYNGGHNSKKEQHQCCNNLYFSLYFLFQKWTRQHKTTARINAIQPIHQLGQVRFNTALFIGRPTEILFNFTTESNSEQRKHLCPCWQFPVYRLSASNTSNRSDIKAGRILRCRRSQSRAEQGKETHHGKHCVTECERTLRSSFL